MIINREQLTKLLVKKTGLEKEEVEGQLSELIKRINKAAEEGKSFEVEGFGTFSVDDGDLHFVPVDRLETEINNRYAGMKPIELIGAFKQTDDEIPEMKDVTEKPDQESWSFDEEAADIKKAGELESEIEKPAEQDEADEPEVEEERKTPVEELMESEESDSDLEDVEKVIETVSGSDSEKEPEKPKPEKETANKEKEESDTMGKILVAAVVVIVLGVTGFFIYDMGLLNNSSGSSSVSDNSEITQTEPQPAQQTKEPVEISEEDQNQTDQTEESTAPEPETTQQPESAQQDEPENLYGLRGEVNETIEGGYTIVVHSLRNRQQAQENRQALADKGFRALISRAVIDEILYFRVGIGQFESVADAQEATKEIPEEYRGSYFIKRIQ